LYEIRDAEDELVALATGIVDGTFIVARCNAGSSGR
jgi:hypothetical protein